MDYEIFKVGLLNRIRQIGADYEGDLKIELYEDGYTPDSDDEEKTAFVKDTNKKYYDLDSNILQGDFIEAEGEKNQISRFNVKYLYDFFRESGWGVIDENIRENLRIMKLMEESDIMQDLYDYEKVRDRIFIRPVNYGVHCRDLNDAIYKRTGDIALVLYLLLYYKNENDRRDVGSMKVRRILPKEWGVKEEELWDIAMLNTCTMAPPRMYLNPMDCYHPPYARGAFMALDSKMELADTDVPTVTTTMQTNGAIALFYPGVQERISEMFGGSYYVAFTADSEARIHKEGTIRPRSVLGNLKSINKAFPDTMLSGKVFYYDKQKKTLEAMNL